MLNKTYKANLYELQCVQLFLYVIYTTKQHQDQIFVSPYTPLDIQ